MVPPSEKDGRGQDAVPSFMPRIQMSSTSILLIHFIFFIDGSAWHRDHTKEQSKMHAELILYGGTRYSRFF